MEKNIENLLKRVSLFLEDGDWAKADEYCEKVLDQDPENAEAYLGKLMAELHVRTRAELGKLSQDFGGYKNYQKALRYGDEALQAELKDTQATARERADAVTKEAETKRKKKTAALIAIFGVLAVLAAVFFSVIRPAILYKQAQTLLADGQYEEAIAAFESLNGYKDSTKYIQKAKIVLAGRNTVAAGYWHMVGMKTDGTLVTVGYNEDGQCDVSGWRDIVAVAAGYSYSLGLKKDGTVIATKIPQNIESNYGQCDVSDWKDIVAIATNGGHTVGLRADGTVVAAGSNKYGQCDVDRWKDIVAVAAGYHHTVGLKADGTVVSTQIQDELFNHGQCDISGWKNIVAVAAGSNHTVGLKKNGTVWAVGSNANGQCDVSDWKRIVSIAAGSDHTVGLKKDGTVVATGFNEYGQCNVSDWKNIVAVAASTYYTVGLKKDGAVVTAGWIDDVSGWKDIRVPEK